MLQTLRDIRPEQRRAIVAGFATLLMLMMGHLLMETARDAVFLANVPATELPVLYLVIAALSFAIARLQNSLGEHWTPHRALVVWLLVAAAASVGLWTMLDGLGDFGVYLLYVWPAVVTTVTMFQFWTLMGNAVTVDDAKRIYVFIGAGGGAGAMLGSAAAAGLASTFAPSLLLVFAAGVWAVAPIGVLVLANALPEELDKEDFHDGSSGIGLEAITRLANNRYARNLVLLSLLIPAAGTIGDYLFKSLAAEYIEASSLGAFFGSVYLVLNFASLIIQLTVVQRVVRRLNIAGAVAILPALLALGGAGAAAGFAFAAAIGIKIADGALRHSLHSTTKELLFVPLSSDLRSQMKSIGSTIGKRGGQALASLALLGIIALGAGPAVFGLALVALAGGAVASALALRKPYFELFRDRLRDDRIEHLLDFPELDADSLEDVVSALSSNNDEKVLAALDLLAAEGRPEAIPTSILYHPSEQVVIRAMTIFVRAGMKEVLPVIERIEDGVSENLHAALISARSLLAPDEEWLAERLDHDGDLVRSTAALQMVAHGWRRREEIDVDIDCIVRRGTPERKQALAAAIGSAAVDDFLPEVAELLDDDALWVRRQAVDAIMRIGGEQALRLLLDKLPDRDLRSDLLYAYREMGDPALDFAIDALHDDDLERPVRWQIPRVVGQFEADRSATALAERLPDENDGVVRARIVAQLERKRLVRGELPVPNAPLRRALKNLVERAYRQMHYRDVLRRESTEEQRSAISYDMLRQLLEDKEENALDLIFRILALLYSDEDVRRARRGIASDERVRRASGRELLEGILPSDTRETILGLVGDEPESTRLQNAPSSVVGEIPDRPALFEHLLSTKSDGLSLLVAQFVGTFRLTETQPIIEEAAEWATGEIAAHLEWTRRRLDDGVDVSAKPPDASVRSAGPEPRDELD